MMGVVIDEEVQGSSSHGSKLSNSKAQNWAHKDHEFIVTDLHIYEFFFFFFSSSTQYPGIITEKIKELWCFSRAEVFPGK